jgi:hypothetical protein
MSHYPRPSRLLGLVTVAALFWSGCGYHFAASGDMLPSSAHTIYVARFGNTTRITGVNDEFMRYVKDEIASHARLTIVDSPDAADLELTGDVRINTQSPVNFNSALEPTTYRNGMVVSAVLKDVHAGKVIWSAHTISASQNGSAVAQTIVDTTPTFLQQNLRAGDLAQMPDLQVAQSQTAFARDQMMQRLAANLYTQMAEGF